MVWRGYVARRCDRIRIDGRLVVNDNPYDKRKPGEALWPERYPLDVLAARRAASERDWHALYQGQPRPAKGEIFSRDTLCYWYPHKSPQPVPVRIAGKTDPQPLLMLPHETECHQYTLSGDLSFKGRDDSDYVSLQVWLGIGSKEYLIDQVHGQKSFSETLAATVSLLKKWPKIGSVLIEDAANGPAILDMLKSSVPGLIPRPTGGGKEARAHAVAPRFEAGDVILPHPTLAPWVSDLVSELISFPRAKHDDQVDALTHYLAWRTTDKSGLDRLLALSQW